jgi:hypothetical protein
MTGRVIMMNGNAELLNYIYQNAEMGTRTIGQLLGIVEDEAFKRQLQNQHDEYEQMREEARRLLNAHGADEKGIGAFEAIRTYLSINLQTIADKSVPHIAEMMIIGSNMGVIDAIRSLKKYGGAEPGIVRLMERLRTLEENNIHTLKNYL